MQEEAINRLLRDALRDEAPSDTAVARARDLMPSPISAALRSMMDAARHLIADLRLDSRLTAALPGFRGPGEGFQLVYTAGVHEVFLRVQSAAGGRGEFRVQGQIESARELGRATVAVGEAGTGAIARELQSDDQGYFELDLPAGRYDLAIGLQPPFLVAGVEIA